MLPREAASTKASAACFAAAILPSAAMLAERGRTSSAAGTSAIHSIFRSARAAALGRSMRGRLFGPRTSWSSRERFCRGFSFVSAGGLGSSAGGRVSVSQPLAPNMRPCAVSSW